MLATCASMAGATGDWVLTCPRELEASIYLAAMTLDLWPGCKEFAGPVKLIGADPKMRGALGPAFANRALAETSSALKPAPSRLTLAIEPT